MGSKDISGKTFTFTNHGDHLYIYGSAGTNTAYMVDYNDAFTQEEHVGKVNHPASTTVPTRMMLPITGW